MRHCDVRKVARDVVVVYAARARVGSKRVRSLASGALDRQWRLAAEEAGLIRGAGLWVRFWGEGVTMLPLVLPLAHLRLASRARAAPNQTIAKVYRESSSSLRTNAR